MFFLVLVMFKGGKILNIALSRSGLDDYVAGCRYGMGVSFQLISPAYLRQIVDLFEKHPCRIPFLAQHCSRCCSFVSFAF